MAKRKIIWSNTAIKRLYAIFETDIRRGNRKEDSIKAFQIISRNLKGIRKNPEMGIRTSEESILGISVGTTLILYSFTEKEIVIHALSEVLPSLHLN